MNVRSLPDGSRGFDANTPISPRAAAAFKAHRWPGLKLAGYSFAVRYVRRAQAHDYDISEAERDVILTAGLGLMIVQHVAGSGWAPSGSLGSSYGIIAAAETEAAGIPVDTTLWCDLEGVHSGVTPAEIVRYCNNWHDAVYAAGYHPGLYVGDSCGLSSQQLYSRLKFEAYWLAYNLNRDAYPAVRGGQMYQKSAVAEDLIPGFSNQNLDVDIIKTDTKGGTPRLVFAS